MHVKQTMQRRVAAAFLFGLLLALGGCQSGANAINSLGRGVTNAGKGLLNVPGQALRQAQGTANQVIGNAGNLAHDFLMGPEPKKTSDRTHLYRASRGWR